jgi:hypothetical protein
MTRETTPLRFLLKTLAGAVAVVGLLIGVSVLVSPPGKAPLAGLAMTSLGDGTFVSVSSVTMGTTHGWLSPRKPTLWEWVQGVPVAQPLEFGTEPAQMMVWVVRHDGRSTTPKHWPALRHARLTAGPDQVGSQGGVVFHGRPKPPGYKVMEYWTTVACNLPIPAIHTTPTTGSPAPPYVYGFQFPLFPAGCGPLKLELLGEAPPGDGPIAVLATLEVPEPTGLPAPSARKASPLPAVSTVGPHALTLKGFRVGGTRSTGGDKVNLRHFFAYDLELTSGGQPAPIHLFRRGPVVDSLGNTYDHGYAEAVGLWFGPHQLTVTAQVPTPEELHESSTVEMAEIAIPADNTVIPLSTKFELRSGRIRGRFVTGGGRGETSQSDPTPSASAPWTYRGGVQQFATWKQLSFEVWRWPARTPPGRRPAPIELRVKAPLVHVLYSAEGLDKTEWLEVDQVLDDQSRAVPFNNVFHHGVRMVFADPLTDAKSLRLRFLVRDVAEFTFVVDPPSPEGK